MFTPERESRRSKVACQWLPILLATCFTACLLSLGSLGTANAQEQPHPATDYPKTIDPWEIIIYEHPDYTGTWIRYKMEPGTRQKLVPQIYSGMEDKVASIQIGSKVKVMLFAGTYFRAGGNAYDDFSDSVSKVELDYRVHSLVVFPKAAGGPLGVWLADVRTWSIGLEEVTFFPLPESEDKVETAWGFLGDFKLDKNANKIWVTESTVAKDSIQVVLYDERDFHGTPLALPGAGGWKPNNLGDYGWSDRAASLRLRWKGPPLALGPRFAFTTMIGFDLPGNDYKSFFINGGPNECEKACAGDAQCRAFTWVKPGVNGPKAECWLKSAAPVSISNSNCVSGYAGPPPSMKAVAPPAWKIQPGLNLPGGDYRHFVVDGGPEECKAACNNEQPNCKAFTWVKPGIQEAKAVCWLKSSVPEATNDPNCTSGYSDLRVEQTQTIHPEFQKMQPLRVFETEYGINRPGGDYKNFPVKGGAGDCEQACAKDPQCKGYTWIKKGAQGTDAVCWLKSAVTLPVYNSETISGVLGNEKAALPPEYQKPASPQTPAQQPQGPQSPIPKVTGPDISGIWQSSIGLIYQIVQTGREFTWTVAQSKERAAGKLSGKNLTVDWVSETAKGSAVGRITMVDATGRPTRIEWNKGAVFFFR